MPKGIGSDRSRMEGFDFLDLLIRPHPAPSWSLVPVLPRWSGLVMAVKKLWQIDTGLLCDVRCEQGRREGSTMFFDALLKRAFFAVRFRSSSHQFLRFFTLYQDQALELSKRVATFATDILASFWRFHISDTLSRSN